MMYINKELNLNGTTYNCLLFRKGDEANVNNFCELQHLNNQVMYGVFHEDEKFIYVSRISDLGFTPNTKPKFNIGNCVYFTNDNGVKCGLSVIFGREYDQQFKRWMYYCCKESYWASVDEKLLELVSETI